MRDIVHLPTFSAEAEHNHEQDIVESDEDGSHNHDVVPSDEKSDAS